MLEEDLATVILLLALKHLSYACRHKTNRHKCTILALPSGSEGYYTRYINYYALQSAHWFLCNLQTNIKFMFQKSIQGFKREFINKLFIWWICWWLKNRQHALTANESTLMGYVKYSSTCHSRTLGWAATCFGRPLLQCTNYFVMLMSLYPAATCLMRPADSQMLDPVPAKVDSDHEWFKFWRTYDEDSVITIEQWRPFHYGK